MKRLSVGVGVGLISAILAAATTSPGAVANEEPSSLSFVTAQNGRQLLPLTETSIETDHEVITFDTDTNGHIRSKTVELRRSHDSLETERETLATYSADTDGSVELQWWDPSGGDIEWTVQKDGDEYARLTGNSFTDNARDYTKAATYTIYGEQPVAVDGSLHSQPFTTIIEVPAIDDSPLGLDAQSTAAVSADNNTDVMIAPTAAATDTILSQYNTFIPTARAETPFDIQACPELVIFPGWGYAGDDRGFATGNETTPSSRTSLELKSTWDDRWLIGQTSRVWTSGTRVLDENGFVRAAAMADLSGVQAEASFWGDDGYGNDLIHTTWTHSVSDPLCMVAPAIDYELSFGIAGKTGRVTLYGEHDQAPAHEWRVALNDQFTSLYQFENRGLQYLFPPFPNAHVDIVAYVRGGGGRG